MLKSLYLIDTKHKWRLHFVIEGESSKIYDLVDKIRQDGRCNYWVANSPEYDNKYFADVFNLDSEYEL